MRKSFAVVLLAVMTLFAFSACNNNPAGNIPVGPGMPGWPSATVNPFKEEAVSTAVSVIDSLDQPTIKAEFIEGIKYFLGVSGTENNPNLDHGSVILSINGDEIGSDQFSDLWVLLLSEEHAPYFSDALNGVVVRDYGDVLASTTISFNNYTNGLKGDTVEEIVSGELDVEVSPRVMLVSVETTPAVVITVNLLGEYEINSVSGSPVVVKMSDGSEYSVSCSDLSGMFTVSADLIGSEIKKFITDPENADITKVIENTEARMYMPSANSAAKITVSGADGKATFEWKELVSAEGFESKNSMGPDSSVLASAEVLPYLSGFGSVRLINTLDKAMANNGVYNDEYGSFTISNMDSLAVSDGKLAFEFAVDSFDYATQFSISEDAGSWIFTANGPQKKATGNSVNLVFTGNVDPEDFSVFVANGYELTANGVKIASDGYGILIGETAISEGATVPSADNLNFDVTGKFDQSVRIVLDGENIGIEGANAENEAHATTFAGLFENVTSMKVSGDVTSDYETLSQVLNMMGVSEN